jgi:signal transduction histidine kinase/DNA-binding NarL/FixJ family response regulator
MDNDKKGILIVDDEEHVRTLIRDIIQPDGYEIFEAANAADGIDLITQKPVDLIITDINMPNISGFEFIKKINQLSKSVPVIAITGYNNLPDDYEFLSMNIFSYMKKPITDTESFNLVVKNALEYCTSTLFGAEIQRVKEYAGNDAELIHQISIAKQEWESAVDFIDKIILLIDTENVIHRCNRSLCSLTGMSYKNLIGKKWNQILKTTGFFPVPGDFHIYGGIEFLDASTERWMLLQIHPYFDIIRGDERLTRQVITFHDITKSKKATEQIRHQREQIRMQNIELQIHKEKLEGALDQISDLIMQVETEESFNIRFENPNLVTCSEVLECTKSGCPCFGAHNSRCWQVAGTHCGGEIQGDFAQKLGRCENCPVYIESTANPVFRIGEHFNNMMNMLDKKNTEVEKAYEKLKATQAQVLQQEKMASIGQLAAGIAHEINNPVGFIMSNLNSLQRYMDRFLEFMKIQTDVLEEVEKTSALPDKLQELHERKKSLKIDFIIEDACNLIKESLDGTERVKHIVQDLKSFSRIDEAEFKMADINAGIESTINIVWNELKYKATLHKDYGDIPMTKCNPGQLNQVFMNILVNAAHAIEQQGEISVKTCRTDGYINVSISDTGSGIPEDKIGRIFEPFFTTKEVGKGTGLGLSIAYDLIHKHHGYIGVDSEVGKGTTFTIKLPVVEG